MNNKLRKSGWWIAGEVSLLCLWVMVSVIAVQLVVSFLLVLLIGKANLGQPVWTAVYSAISYTLAMVLIILVPPKIVAIWKAKHVNADKKSPEHLLGKKVSRADLGLHGWPTWTDVGLGPVGFIVSLLLAAILVYLFTLFPWFDAGEAQNLGFSIYMSGGERIVAFLTLVVIAPIAEEIIFRGWLYGKVRILLSEKISGKWGIVVSILVVSVLFGLVHLQWNVGVNVFALSVVLCVLREITGTIYAGILTHMLKNGVAFYSLYVIGIA